MGAGVLLAAWSFGALGVALAAEPATINFDRDIRPIFSDTCYACHGPDDAKRKAKSAARSPRERVGSAGTTGRPSCRAIRRSSALYRRITSDDPNERMPPPTSGRQLTRQQIELIGRWIKEGARWEEHWSLLLPSGRRLRGRARSRVVPQCDRRVRVSRGWTRGTSSARRRRPQGDAAPPRHARSDRLAADARGGRCLLSAIRRPNAYEKVVDRLLASPRYGERMAIRWLDAARYADTNGYQTDGERLDVALARLGDRRLQRNMPFDRFTIEQLAGDLLPNATLDQKIASGFNRNHRGNGEGGIIPEEYLVEYVVDRVETTSTVWLGLTLGCAAATITSTTRSRRRSSTSSSPTSTTCRSAAGRSRCGNSPPDDQGADARRSAASWLGWRLAAARPQQAVRPPSRRARAGASAMGTIGRPRLCRPIGRPSRDLVAHWPFDGSIAASRPQASAGDVASRGSGRVRCLRRSAGVALRRPARSSTPATSATSATSTLSRWPPGFARQAPTPGRSSRG